MTIALLMLGVALLAVVGVGAFVFFNACLRQPELPWFDKEKLDKTAYGAFYDHIVAARDWMQCHDVREVTTLSEDGHQLFARWIVAKDPRGTMILVHGYHSGIWSDFGLVLDYYHNLNMNILLPDQRCHGRSEGVYTTFGVKESRDLLCWLDFHKKELGGGKVLMSGLSMGASTVMFLTEEELPDNVVGRIADCGFTSPKEIIGKVFHDVTHLPPYPWLLGTELCARVLAGFSLSEKNSMETLSGNRRPILLVHGLADDFVPCDMTQRSYEACTGDKQLLLVEDAGHGVSFLVERERYCDAVIALLDKTLGKKERD